MKKVWSLMGVIMLTLLLVSCNQKKSNGAEGEWIQLFNGKDLAGR